MHSQILPVQNIPSSAQPQNFELLQLFERRQSPRSVFLGRATTSDNKDEFIIESISMTGLLAKSKQARWPGQLLKIEFYLPIIKEQLSLWVKVIELSPKDHYIQHKLQFCYLTPKAVFTLYRYIDRCRHLWR